MSLTDGRARLSLVVAGPSPITHLRRHGNRPPPPPPPPPPPSAPTNQEANKVGREIPTNQSRGFDSFCFFLQKKRIESTKSTTERRRRQRRPLLTTSGLAEFYWVFFYRVSAACRRDVATPSGPDYRVLPSFFFVLNGHPPPPSSSSSSSHKTKRKEDKKNPETERHRQRERERERGEKITPKR